MHCKIENLNDGTIKPGGVNDTLKGMFYQVLLIVLSLMKSKNDEFQIITEMCEAGLFDDIVLKKNIGSVEIVRLMQAKYKIKQQIIDFDTFFMRKEFMLRNYYDSYLNVRNLFNNLKDVIICTNNKILNETDDHIELIGERGSIFLEKVATEDDVFGNSKGRYKFSSNFNFRRQSQICLRDKFKLKSNRTNNADIREFMDKMLFVFDFQLEDIQDQIDKILQIDFQMQNVAQFRILIESKITEWIKNVHIEKSLESTKLRQFYNEIQEDILRHKFSAMAQLAYEGDIEFNFYSLDTGVHQFVTQVNTNKFLCIQCQPNENIYCALKIYQYLKNQNLDTFQMMQTSFQTETFKQGIELFCTNVTINICVIEINDDNKDIVTNYKQQLLQTESCKKVIIISQEEIFPGDAENVIRLVERKFKLSDLNSSSIEKMLSKRIKLQEKEISFRDLIDENDVAFHSKIPLLSIHKLQKQNSIGGKILSSSDYDPDLYVRRKVKIKSVVHKKFLGNPPADIIFSKDEKRFIENCQKFPEKNVMLLEKVEDRIICRQFSGDVTRVRDLLDQGQSLKLEENDLLVASSAQKIFIPVDIAGMGKTFLLNKVAYELKEKHNDYWIVNVNLNKQAVNLENNEFTDENSVITFLSHVLELSDEFAVSLFTNAVKKGEKIVVILDGVDETSPIYDRKVLKLIEILSKMYIKIYISTRPELGDEIERITGHLRIFIKPFNRYDQEDCLRRYWMKNVSGVNEFVLRRIAKVAIESYNNVVEDQEILKFMGMPLITRMLAEILIPAIQSSETCAIKQTRMVISNLYSFYNHFVNRKLEIYLIEKRNVDRCNVNVMRLLLSEKTELRKLHQKFAFKNFFPSEFSKSFPKNLNLDIDENNLLTILKCGIVSGTLELPAFTHKTFREFFVLDELIEHLPNKETQMFIAIKILPKFEKFPVIKSLFVSWISLEECQEKLCWIQMVLLYNFQFGVVQYSLLFEILVEKQNRDLFDQLFQISIKFHTKEVKKFLELFCFEKTSINDSKEFTLLTYYFQTFSDDINILDLIYQQMGPKFLKRILLYNFQGLNLLMYSLEKTLNFQNILNCIEKNFRDIKPLNEILEFAEDEDGQNILQYIIVNMKSSDPFFKFLEKIIEISIKKNSRKKLNIESLIAHRDSSGWSILNHLIKERFKPAKILLVMKWIEENLGRKMLIYLFVCPVKKTRLWKQEKISIWDFLLRDATESQYNYEMIKTILDYFDELQNTNPSSSSFKVLQKLAHQKHSIKFHLPLNLQENSELTNFQVAEDLKIIKKLRNDYKFCSQNLELFFCYNYCAMKSLTN